MVGELPIRERPRKVEQAAPSLRVRRERTRVREVGRGEALHLGEIDMVSLVQLSQKGIPQAQPGVVGPEGGHCVERHQVVASGVVFTRSGRVEVAPDAAANAAKPLTVPKVRLNRWLASGPIGRSAGRVRDTAHL